MHFASYYRWLVYSSLYGEPEYTTTLLDIGSGDGTLAGQLATRMSVALDTSLTVLRLSKASFNICADGTQIPLRQVMFDHVLLSDVVEHVSDDAALIASAAAYVKPGGILWLSTTASNFQLFPTFITQRAEQSWGHVRKGYTIEHLVQLIGDTFECQAVAWSEVVFRHSYLLIWALAKYLPALARSLTGICFQIDRRMPRLQENSGHIYIRAIRRGGVAR